LKERIDYLDGLRGVAILLVLGFHAYARWPEIVPYGDTYQNFPIFKLGWLGVQLFFLISGFVIFMTLDKTTTFRLFIYKRWIRLFPAMILASLLIYISLFLLEARPAEDSNVLSLIPGLTFIEPGWWSKFLGIKIHPLEGAFWSLYVEFKFYVLAGLIYFVLGRNSLTPSLFILFVGSLGVSYISGVTDIQVVNILQKICNALSLKHFGWFCSGAAFYLYQQTKNESCYFLSVGIAIISSIFMGSVYAIIAALMITGLFATSLRVGIVQRLLTQRVFMFFGFVSYPLYLIHENAMISMIVELSPHLLWLNMFFYPLIPIAVLSLISFLIAKIFESKVRLAINAVGQSKLNKVSLWTR